jgi:nucleoside-diphosphate-sugar epimerase
MPYTRVTRNWHQLRKEAAVFPWRGVLLRMLVDIILVNISMVLAFLSSFLVYAFIVKTDNLRDLAVKFETFVAGYWVFWTLLAVLVFHMNGFYTRTRGYASRYKILVILRAVTLFMLVFVFTDYLVMHGVLLPRGVAIAGWLLTLLTVGGARFGKDLFFARYRVQPARRNGNGKVTRVLVVGGAGYLGSALVRLLLARDYQVRVLDALLFGSKSLDALEGNPRCELIKGDVRNIDIVVEAMNNCDAVIDLAAIVGDPACEVSRSLAIEVNRAATRMLIDIARGYGIRRFVFASTCSVYGASDHLVDERTKVAPISTYARTKVDSESLLLEAKSLEFHPTVLRLATLFGLSPRPRFDLVVNLLTARAATTGKITIFNGEQWRPFLHISDAARAIIAILGANEEVVSGQIFNVGDYELNFTLKEVSDKIARVIPGLEIEYLDNADRRNYHASFDKINRRLGFTCEKSLEEGIEEIYALIRSGRIQDFNAAEFNNVAITRVFVETPSAEKSSMKALAALAEPSYGHAA